MKATYTRSDNNTYAIFVDAIVFEVSILDSLLGCNKRILCVKVKLTEFLAVEMIGGIKSLNLTRKLCFEFRGVKMRNGRGTANSVQGIVPCGIHIIAYRSYCAESGYDNSL